MPTIRECFETDHANCFNQTNQLTLATPDGKEAGSLGLRCHFDFLSNSKFISVYLETEKAVADLVESIPSLLESLLKQPGGHVSIPTHRAILIDTNLELGNKGDDGIAITFTEPGSAVSVSLRDLIFTQRVYCYTPFDVPIKVQTEFSQRLMKHGVSILFRGLSYANAMSKSPIAFVSHDSRDKDSIARPIATRLRVLGHDVWYDEFSLNPGDSLRESIEAGLKSCSKCIVILTPNFLSKGGWAKREYDSAYTREIVEDKRVIIPVWAGVSTKDVYEYSPILADRVGLAWSIGEEEACKKLNLVLSKDG